MTHYHKKLTKIQNQRQKLIETEKVLLHKRKCEIADLAEQFDLLTIDNTVLTNCFAKLKEHSNELRSQTSLHSRRSSPSESNSCEVENERT